MKSLYLPNIDFFTIKSHIRKFHDRFCRFYCSLCELFSAWGDFLGTNSIVRRLPVILGALSTFAKSSIEPDICSSIE
jgi:hypothetical protein